jgi:hypothetical protein
MTDNNPFTLVYDGAITKNEPGKVRVGATDKELFIIDGATHIETYWLPKYVDTTVKKLTEFFRAKPNNTGGHDEDY